MENLYLKLRRNVIYTALEDLPDTDWFWSPSEIEEFDWLWSKDVELVKIAEEMGRSEYAVMFLSFDRLAKGLIEPREGWKIW